MDKQKQQNSRDVKMTATINDEKKVVSEVPKESIPTPPLIIISEREQNKIKVAEMKKHDDVPTRGKFMNLRAPGKSVKLTYVKYSTDAVKWWLFEHGKEYTIPRGFADQINEHYGKIQHDKTDNENMAILESFEKDPIYAFVPVSF